MSDNERLEEIKVQWKNNRITPSSVFWLFEQAERVQELEEFKTSAEKLYKNYHISAKKIAL